MAKFAEGNSGRPKGAANKITADLKAMILGALEAAGGQKYLQKQADANSAAFMALLGKILPLSVKHAGDSDGSPIQANIVVTFIKPKDG